MKRKTIFVITLFVFSLMVLSGCTLFSTDNTTTYQSHPTSISCTLTYGYWVNCTGAGNYEINYDCDVPEVINGQVSSVVVHNSDYKDITLASFNAMKRWNISSNENLDYKLGISANFVTESFIVSDLKGRNALTIEEIRAAYPDLVNQYCNAQSNDTGTFIDPEDPVIKAQATEIYNNANTENSFLVAKEIFKWLKQQTNYERHTDNNNVQQASFTFQCKTGDCDDLSFLYISLCRAVKIPARFIRGFLVEKINGDVEVTPHAWAEVYVGGDIGNSGWIPVECAGTSDDITIEVHQNFGVESANHIRLFKDDGTDESLKASLSGLSYIRYGINRDIDSESITLADNYQVLQSNELVVNQNNKRSYQ